MSVPPPDGAVSYEVGAEDFLIGGSSGCDLRLPTAKPSACPLSVSRKPDGIRVRRVTPVLPVLLNGQPLPANATTAVASGDVLTVADIRDHSGCPEPTFDHRATVRISRAGSPATHSSPPLGFDAGESSRSLEDRRHQHESADVVRAEEWKRRDAELIRRARDLDRQTEELESDRVLWYQRRQEIEQELERQRRRHRDWRDCRRPTSTRSDRELARVEGRAVSPPRAIAEESIRTGATNWLDNRTQFAKAMRAWRPTGSLSTPN